jgi:prophage antirepressor-like protein
MNELTIFLFQENREVRTLERDGEPWFVAKDVCDILGLENARKAISDFPDDERANVTSSDVKNLDIPNRGVNIINEPGLYRLIFQSRKPEAAAFKRWVFHEVLPAIRRNGVYSIFTALQKRQDELEQRIENPLSFTFRGPLKSASWLPEKTLNRIWQERRLIETALKAYKIGLISRDEARAILGVPPENNNLLDKI